MTAELRLHKGQMEVLRSAARFKVVVAGRRWGKTRLARTAIIEAAATKKNRLVWYVAPTYRMAKNIMWWDMIESIPRAWMRKTNETFMRIELINGSVIELKGADKPDTLRGVGLDYLVLDEFQDMREDTWHKVLRPTLSSTGGDALIIGTPKSFNLLYDLYMKGQKERLRRKGVWISWQFTTFDSPFVPRAEIEAAKNDLDEKSFRQEYMACHLPETQVRLWNDQVRAIHELQRGDILRHVNDDGEIEPCEVIDLGPTGEKPTLEVEIETGETVTASYDHKFKVYEDVG